MTRSAPQGPVIIGPGPLTPAIRIILFTSVAVFLVHFMLSAFAGSDLVVRVFGLSPRAVLEGAQIWRLVTYLFVHDAAGFMHILFNMLALWMFGVDLEHRWGSRGFVRYYAVTGVGAGFATTVLSLLPFDAVRGIYTATTIGASGAIYGLLLAWALLFPHRRILFLFIFPLPARTAALIMGAMAFLAATSGRNTSVAEVTHLAGLVIGWVYLGGPASLRLELKYRLSRWRMDRARRRFSLHRGGRRDDDWRVH